MSFGRSTEKDSPRRKPRQSRSIITVNSILEAAATLFARNGFEATTTTQIAELAGVAVGTLYEYFPNKDTLAAKLIKIHCDQLLEAYVQRFEAERSESADRIIQIFIEVTFNAYATNKDLHRALLEQMGRISKLRHLKRVSLDITNTLQDALIESGELQSRDDCQLQVFIIENTIEALIHRTLLYSPEHFDKNLCDELFVLVSTYLKSRTQ